METRSGSIAVTVIQASTNLIRNLHDISIDHFDIDIWFLPMGFHLPEVLIHRDMRLVQRTETLALIENLSLRWKGNRLMVDQSQKIIIIIPFIPSNFSYLRNNI